jgi:hypothetical protein
VSYELYPDRPYNYVNNLPPCLKNNPEFSSIWLCHKPTFRLDDSPTLNAVSANAQSLQPQCDECQSWIDKYYTDVPLLQSRLKYLKDQVDILTNENNRLQSITQAKEKRLKTTGSVIFKNVEATIAIINKHSNKESCDEDTLWYNIFIYVSKSILKSYFVYSS